MPAGRYRLINARPSPYGRKVAIALLEKGLAFDVTYDEPWSDHSTTGDYSPLQQLPILITPEGDAVCDSSHILDWLEIRHPKPALLPEAQADRLAALNMKALGERLMEIAQSLIFEMHRPQPAAAWIDRQTAKIAGGLGELDRLSALPFASHTVPLHLGHIAVATSLLVWEFVVAHGISPPIAVLRWRGTYPTLTELIEQLEVHPSFVMTQPGAMPVNISAAIS
jgi:glutathione S-transferase